MEYENHIAEYGAGEMLGSISDLLSYWPTTLTPTNVFWAKGMSVFVNDTEFVSRTKAVFNEVQGNSQGANPMFFCEVCGNVLLPDIAVICYCYVYKENAPFAVRETWPRSFIRICFMHFVTRGVDNYRVMAVRRPQPKWSNKNMESDLLNRE